MDTTAAATPSFVLVDTTAAATPSFVLVDTTAAAIPSFVLEPSVKKGVKEHKNTMDKKLGRI